MRTRKAQADVELMAMSVFYVIMAVVVGLAFLGFVRSMENNSRFEKSFLAKDLSYLTNAIYLLPGDLEIRYTAKQVNLADFAYDFEDSKISVKGATQEHGQIPFEYRYAHQSMPPSTASVINPYDISFGKRGANIFLGKIPHGKTIPSCGGPSTRREWSSASVLIDPGHGSSPTHPDPGHTNGDQIEEEITARIAGTLKQFRTDTPISRSVDGQQRFVPLEDRLFTADRSSLVISLHVGSHATNDIRIYHQIDSKSRKLACLIAHRLITTIPQLGSIDLFPVSAGMLPNSDHRKILMTQTVAVQIEFGGIRYPYDDPIHHETNNIASAIWAGIGDYYG